MKDIDIKLRLSAQRALWGQIPPCLRSASIEIEENEIKWRCIFDEGATDEDMELLACAAGEIIADFSEGIIIQEEYKIVPFPNKLEHLRWLVYYRHEHNYYK